MASWRPEPDVFLDALPRVDAPAAVPTRGSASSGGLEPSGPVTRSTLGDSVAAERPQAVEESSPPVSAAGHVTEPPRSPSILGQLDLMTGAAVGGLLFALVWLPVTAPFPPRTLWFAWTVAVLLLALVVLTDELLNPPRTDRHADRKEA
jgi:hypothetical protein